LEAIRAGTVQPGKYLVLIGGDTASVEEAVVAGRSAAAGALVDVILLPDVHLDVVQAVGGARRASQAEALGVIETSTVAATIGAADAGIKGAAVELLEIRMADGLGGKAYVLFGGTVFDVQAAVEIGVGRLEAEQLVGRVVIPRLHPEMSENLWADPRFAGRVRSADEGD
ncbi:MAG: BMC domain-containing protein, partial [Acidimicrobiia bacterium]